MRLVIAKGSTLLLNQDGTINSPFSLFLNYKFSNPHTRESTATGLRLFHRFVSAHSINLAHRALVGQCLKPSEIPMLVQLAYRPIAEVERMEDAMIRRITKANPDKPAMDIKGAVEPNTAARRLDQIGNFLDWYFKNILDQRILGTLSREELRQRYNQTINELKGWINGTASSHHHQIQSLPQERFLQIIREIFLNPAISFMTVSGDPSATMMRDRAIGLLAAEGLRPGAIGNLTLADFRWRPGDPNGYICIRDNTAKRQSRITTNTPVQKGARSTTQSYNSEITVKLWPWTCMAIHEYLCGERGAVTGRQLRNMTKGFLFVAEHGEPIGDRTTLSAVFKRLERGLMARGLLDTAPSDPYHNGSHYSLTAYTLRHSAATLFFSSKRHESDVFDQMRERFGWSEKSKMPELYARRAISDSASLDMIEFFEVLINDSKNARENGK